MNPTLKKVIITLVAAGILALLIWFRIQDGNGSNRGGQGPQSRPAVSVEGYLVTPESFRETIFTTGTVLADEEIYIRPESSGRITGIYFDEDSAVRTGDLLVKLNDAELQQQLRSASYQINLATLREKRQRELLSRNAIAQEDYDMVLNELNILEAQKDRIQAQIDKMEIRAPFDGVVGLKEISIGSFVSPDVVISSLQKMDTVKIEFTVPERHRPMVARGQRIRFQQEGSENMRQGTVYALHPRVDRETRSLRMRAITPNSSYELYPGAFVRIEMDLREIKEALLIPAEALIPKMTGFSVFVHEDGRSVLRDVQAGTRTDRMVHITEGLSPGDTVITTGLLQIRDGMTVSMTNVSRPDNASLIQPENARVEHPGNAGLIQPENEEIVAL